MNYWRNGTRNFGGLAFSPKAKRLPHPRVLDVIVSRRRLGFRWFSLLLVLSLARTSVAAQEFRFYGDTLAFANQTVFEYHEGHPSLRRGSAVKRDAYNRHCFVLCRTAMQFKKFARFDPRRAPLDDKSLAARIRAVTHRSAWQDPLPPDQRIVFPGYKDLREMSQARRELFQVTIGH